MKKSMLKIGCLTLMSALVVSSLAGCKAKVKETTTESKAAYTGRFEKTLEIKLPVYDRGIQGEAAVDNNYWTKWMADKALKDINVKVTYVPIPRNQDVDKFNLLLAANDAPDVIYSYDYPVISSFTSRGAFQEITSDMLDTYGPNLKKYLGDELLAYGKIDGKQMLIPAKRPMLGDYAGTIRKDWLDKVGMKVPTTNDELYAVLKAFKTQDPGGVGKDKVIPMTMSGFGNNSQSTPYWSFLDDKISDRDFAIYSDLIVTPLTWEPAKKALQMYNKFYNEGLVSPEFALDADSKKAEAAISNGQVGIFSARISKSPPIFETLVKNVPTAKFEAMPGLVQTAGAKQEAYGYYPYGMLSGINKNAENPEAVIAYYDWMSKTENLNSIENGIEGKTYKMVDGLPVMDSTYKGAEKLILNTNRDYLCILSSDRDTGDDAKNIKIKSLSDAPTGFTDYFVENYNASLKAMNTNNFTFTSPVTSLTKNSNTLKAKYQEYGIKLIMCKPAEFEALYKTYSKEYLSSGYQEIIDEKGKLYDAQIAKK